MTLTPTELLANLELLKDTIRLYIKGERANKLLKLYEDWGSRIATAPASSKKSYHNCFAGGYALHVLNVVQGCIKLLNVWKDMGANIDFTVEEMIFAALNHDLGKIGDENNDYYIPCQEDWLIKKGQLFTYNPSLQYMKVSDRSLMVLANRGIQMSDKEYLAIKLHDGLYEDSNKAYLISYNDDYQLKTLLPYIVHQADLMASKIEPFLQKSAAKNAVSNKTTGTKVVDRFLKE